MDKKTTGIYNKFTVIRTDGKSRLGQKHFCCRYFVLDLDHDPHARAALKAYAESCALDFPVLSADVVRLAETIPEAQP